MKIGSYAKRIFRWFVQYLNIFLFGCGRAAVVMTVGSYLTMIFGKLYFLEERLAVLRIALGLVILALLLTIPVHLSARKMKCKIPRIKKKARSYLMAELYAPFAVSFLHFLVNEMENRGVEYWKGVAVMTVGGISFCTTVLCLIQLLLWSVGSDVGDGPYLTFDE